MSVSMRASGACAAPAEPPRQGVVATFSGRAKRAGVESCPPHARSSYALNSRRDGNRRTPGTKKAVTTILLVDDDPAVCEVVTYGLAAQGVTVDARTRAPEAFALLATGDYACVVTDLAMPEMHGFELIERIVANRPELPVIVLTGTGDFPTAVAAMRAGAFDFCTKPIDLAQIGLAVKRAAESRALRAEVTRLRRVVAEARRFDALIGASAAMQEVYGTVEQVGPTDATVLLTGESGTGKEMVARALHARSKRAPGPFVAVDCAAIPDTLIESELFGHARGAFTDAKQARLGLVAQASGGTLFLDEIAELPLAVQPKLLRVLQERCVRSLGGDGEVAVDIRVIAATHRDLAAMVTAGEFREDLYYRVHVVQLPLPPLRARAGDALILAQHFIEHFARLFDRDVRGLTPEAARRIRDHDWPGNVRELRNAIERAVAMCNTRELTVEDLPERARGYRPGPPSGGEPTDITLDEMERRHILRVIDVHRGNKAAAAHVLGIDRKTLYRKLLRYGSERDA